MADDTARSWLSCLGWGCLAVVVISALGIGGCVWVAYRGGSDAHAVTEGYLQAVSGGRFDDAYGYLGPAFTGERGVGDLAAFEDQARQEAGSCGQWRLSGTSLNRDSGRSTAVLTYLLDCERGALEAVFNLEKTDGGWLIQGVGYREPGGATLPTCPACGEVVPLGARFCPSCGEALAEAPAAGGPAESGD